MSDLIKREDAIKIMACEMYAEAQSQGYEVDSIEDFMPEAKAWMNDAPSADRPQAEWIRTGRTNIYGGIEVQCSNCGDKVMVQHLEDEWYCRHCGADMGMKGADDEV